jgi:hypothetical protein
MDIKLTPEEKPQKRTEDVMQEKARVRLEKQEADLKADGKWKEGPDDGVEVIGPRSYNPIQVQEGSPSKEYLFANRNRQIVQMRRAEGWRESTVEEDSEGKTTNEIGDLVQMEMPKDKYVSTVLAPEKARREARLSAVESEFHNMGDQMARATNGGIETFGNIKFDHANS